MVPSIAFIAEDGQSIQVDPMDVESIGVVDGKMRVVTEDAEYLTDRVETEMVLVTQLDEDFSS